MRLPGLSAPVTVRRDGLGVPHLQASSLPDLMRAQGYVTAQDRMWQMDLLRRRAEGQLAEAFGSAALVADRDVRTLGLGDAARRALPQVPSDLRVLIDAYADGVNAWLSTHGDSLPLEFHLLRYAPRPWEAADSLAVGKLLALDLAQGWEDEALRARVYDRLPADVQAMLFPKLFAQDRILVGQDVAVPSGGGEALTETARGSNNWVVSGAHTASGRPLLANDPHLALGVPSIWAAVHLTSPEMDVAGVVLTGTPGVTLGRNRRIAWGCTNVHDDSADLYVEEFDPRDPDLYRTADGWERVQVRHEAIRVRGGRAVVDLAHRGSRRPLHPPRSAGDDRRGSSAALDGLADDAVELTAFARLQRAGDWNEFREAVRFFRARAELRLRGRGRAHRLVRRRPHAHPRAGDGARPYRGEPRRRLAGLCAFDALPHVFDPPSGRIVTANNRLVGTDYPYKVTRGGIGPGAQPPFSRTGGARGLDDRRLRPAPGRAAVPSPPRSRAGVAGGGGPHHGEPAWDEIAREMEGWDGRPSRAAAPPRRPCSPSARSARA